MELRDDEKREDERRGEGWCGARQTGLRSRSMNGRIELDRDIPASRGSLIVAPLFE
jgi:hypothetical protein